MTTTLIKPKQLHRGDKVAIVSLSSGMLGEKRYLHKYELGKSRLEELFGLEVVAMPNALKGIRYLYEHPEKRAEDWMQACEDSSIKAIITSIGEMMASVCYPMWILRSCGVTRKSFSAIPILQHII